MSEHSQPSMYAQYLHEREGFSILEEPRGFATYKQIDQDTYYLRDVFVMKEHRKSGVGSELLAKISEIAKENGAKRIQGSVCLDAKNVEQSMAVIIASGFRFLRGQGNMLYFVLDI